jgi:hypothetical protein
MIVKEYHQGINCTMPTDYFERWYADMWKRCINSHIAQPNQLQTAVRDELKKVGADVKYITGYKYQVTFREDSDYTIFVLRWS